MPKPQPTDPSIQIVKNGTCMSMSGSSKLTYQVGRKDDGTAMLRLVSNSAAGQFSKDWLPVSAVEKVLRGTAAKDGLTSYALQALFPGKSVNTAGFLLAVLKQEGAVTPHPDKPRQYLPASSAGLHLDEASPASPAGSKRPRPAAKTSAPAKKAIQKAATRKG
jgi:hypothetical protein